MGPIVCATRGGEASRSTQEHAFALAQAQDAELHFLYVADCGFAGTVRAELLDAVRDELMYLGRSLLAIAQARATRKGLKAHTVVLCGPVRETIHNYLLQVGASALVLGASGAPTRHRAFSPEEVIRFAKSVAQGTGAAVYVVSPEGKALGYAAETAGSPE